jgi:hypothetical protein
VGKIFLIAADWQFRALVHAQLLEEGFQVRPLPSLEAALQDLVFGSEKARLIISDTKDLDLETEAVADLLRLMGEVPLVLCGDALSRSSLDRVVASQWITGREGIGPVRVLLRPFRVGDLVREVRRLWACPEGEAATGASLDAGAEMVADQAQVG